MENRHQLEYKPEKSEEKLGEEMFAQYEIDHPKPTEKEQSYILTMEEVEQKMKALEKVFDNAEYIFTVEGRETTKPFLITIYSEMEILNKADKRLFINPLSKWNPQGYLSEEEFNIINLRRKILSNEVGIMTESGIVRHDLNKID